MTKPFALQTADPLFDPSLPVVVNGFEYQPVMAASAEPTGLAGPEGPEPDKPSRPDGGIPSADEVQAVRDLIILHCEHDPDWHARGAKALRIVNRLSDAAHADAWQPIETAPKDGTHILIARAGEDAEMTEITEWCVHQSYHWEQVSDDLYRKVPDEPHEFWNGNGHRATHWMPLPPPPHMWMRPMTDLLSKAQAALLQHGCGVTHQGQPVFCDDERLPDSCRWYFCRCRRDAAIVVEAIEAQQA